MIGHKILVLGGARSGKSRYAQRRAEALLGHHVFIATAHAYDDEMRERIAHHRAERDARWITVDAPYDLTDAIETRHGTGAIVLVDCLTLWASNLLLAEKDVATASVELCQAISRFDGSLILVSNEVGFGIVPENDLARRFRDIAGRLNQNVASVVREVQLVVAGLSITVKENGAAARSGSL